MTIELQFLGAATTVTGSQFLLTTDQATILIDCGMFQGSPNESVRNRIPLAFDPKELDAILLTHAHLDHCGLIPHVVQAGFGGPIWATKGTVELAALVLLDSGKLQEEFAKRDARWEKRHPDKAAAEDLQDAASLEAAVALAAAGEQPVIGAIRHSWCRRRGVPRPASTSRPSWSRCRRRRSTTRSAS
jgi:metallo-beta-lactamase family protein